jgi:hypothetical protein
MAMDIRIPPSEGLVTHARAQCYRMTLQCELHYNAIPPPLEGISLALEERTARMTILIDPRKKAVFERLSAAEDSTPSQVVRRLLRAYIESRTGKPWAPEADVKGFSRRRSD